MLGNLYKGSCFAFCPATFLPVLAVFRVFSEITAEIGELAT